MNTGAVSATGEDLEMTEGQLKMQVKRFKRKDEGGFGDSSNARQCRGLPERSATASRPWCHIERLEHEPEIIIVMGDHQPLYKENTDFTVPIHVMAKDKRWLTAFREQGFKMGMKLGYQDKAIRHEGFYSLMVRAVAVPAVVSFHRIGRTVSVRVRLQKSERSLVVESGDPARRTGGFIYNAKMVDEMRQGHEVHVLRLDAEWPFRRS